MANPDRMGRFCLVYMEAMHNFSDTGQKHRNKTTKIFHQSRNVIYDTKPKDITGKYTGYLIYKTMQ